MDELPAELLLEQEIALLRQQLTALRIDLSGKDWLTVDEAAHYCGVSVSQFNSKAGECGLSPRQFMGKKLYEKSELYRAIHDSGSWKSRSAVTSAPSAGTTSPQVAEALARLRRHEQRQGKR
ncbi:hypothetical protein [Stenotrophomonas sp.]|uniref:hypothetical protein n=1 Tax=Stenotrophomonas sp. TaxID=69392 RepID=UPI002D504718|nr:hypothetical protein [Stenotrophomonas sp.]HYQ25120.1 hypothetical protein [Stenotrophomonas sp.]